MGVKVSSFPDFKNLPRCLEVDVCISKTIAQLDPLDASLVSLISHGLSRAVHHLGQKQDLSAANLKEFTQHHWAVLCQVGLTGKLERGTKEWEMILLESLTQQSSPKCRAVVNDDRFAFTCVDCRRHEQAVVCKNCFDLDKHSGHR